MTTLTVLGRSDARHRPPATIGDHGRVPTYSFAHTQDPKQAAGVLNWREHDKVPELRCWIILFLGMSLRVLFATCSIAAFGSCTMPFDALSQKQSLKEQLVGTWKLLSWEQRNSDGSKVERYGTSPAGVAIFDAGGTYIITVMQSDRAKYASNALWQGTPEENKETADGTITYFGTYLLAETESSIAIHIEGSSFPNWNGTDQKRFVAIAGDQLTLTVRPPGGDVVDVIWKRAN